MVINSILKNFSFMIAQNKGNPEGIENGLRAIVENTTIAIYLGVDFLKTEITISTIIFHMEKT